MLSGNKYTSRSSLGSAIYQCLQQIPKEDCLSTFRDWVKRVTNVCFSKGGILRRFVIKICLIIRSTEIIRTQWQNVLQDPRTRTVNILSTNELVKLTMLWTTGPRKVLRDIRKTFLFYQKCMLCVLIRIASPSIVGRKDISKWSSFASRPVAMFNPQWLKIPMSRPNFHGPKNVQACEIRLYFSSMLLAT